MVLEHLMMAQQPAFFLRMILQDLWKVTCMLCKRYHRMVSLLLIDFDVSTRLVGISVNRDWRPYVVLAVGELLGYIVRSITGETQTLLSGQKWCM